MESYLKGRVRNLNLSPKRCHLPVFEAVMNSLQAIDDRIASGWDGSFGRINIVVTREEPSELFDAGNVPMIQDVLIADNGVGFDDEHFTAFRRLDDDFRIAKGGKGIGRLSWLSAFECVLATSVYEQKSGVFRKRSFEYTIEADGIRNELDIESEGQEEVGTSVQLCKLQKRF